jgi:hypothetical protein
MNAIYQEVTYISEIATECFYYYSFTSSAIKTKIIIKNPLRRKHKKIIKLPNKIQDNVINLNVLCVNML